MTAASKVELALDVPKVVFTPSATEIAHGLTCKYPGSAKDVEDAPREVIAQLMDGSFYSLPRPATPHASAISDLFTRVGSRFCLDRVQDLGAWWMLLKPELHLGGDIVVPDIAGWRRERMPRIPRASFISLAPDWVCEGISPSTARLDRGPKMNLYLREQVQYLWLLDAYENSLETYRHHGEHWLRLSFHAGDVKVRLDPFAELELDLSEFWLPEDPADPVITP